MSALSRIIPAFEWMSGYNRDDFRGDVSAGLTVGVMLIPQSMAYAMLAGVNPIYGLYAGLVPLLMYALLGTSRHLSVGPVTVDMLIVAAGIGILAGEGTGVDPITLAVMVAAMTGIIEILMGVMRFGFMVNFLSRPVIAGFMTAAPLIIAFNQLGSLTGIEGLPGGDQVHKLLLAAVEQAGTVHSETLAVGLTGVVVLLVFQKFKPRWPAALIWVSAAIAASWWFGLSADGVTTVKDIMEGEIPSGLAALPWPELPAFDLATVRKLAPTALTLALVQFMYVMSLGQAFASEHDYDVDANRELFAIGAANIAGSLFHAVPVSGSFSRSAVNNRAGAHTPLSNVLAAGLVAVALVLLTPLLSYLPVPALAAIIMVACVGMIDVPELRYLLKTRWVDGAVALVTFAATLAIGIQPGILIGVAASIVVVLWDLSRPNVVELGHMPGTQEFRDVERNPEAESISDIHIIRIDSRFSFANAKVLKDELLHEAAEDGVRALIIDTSGVNDLDTTATASLGDVIDELSERDIQLHVVGAKGPVRDVMRRSGLQEQIGEENFFLNTHLAVTHILEGWEEEEEYPLLEEERQVEELDEARKRLRAERRRAEEERERMDLERERLRDEIAGHEAEQETIQEEKERLLSQLRQTREQRDELRRERQKVEAQQQELEGRQQELEARQEELESQKKQLEDQQQQLAAEKKEVKQQKEEVEQERERFEGEQKEHERKNVFDERARLKAEIESLMVERDEIDQTRRKLRTELKEAGARRHELRSERREIEAQQEELEAARQKLREERKRLEAERKKTKAKTRDSSDETFKDERDEQTDDRDGADEDEKDEHSENDEDGSERSESNKDASEEFEQPI